MSQATNGILYRGGSAHSVTAELTLSDSFATLRCEDGAYSDFSIAELNISDAIPGVATEIRFTNGDLFIADDNTFRVEQQSGRTLSFLESNQKSVLFSLIMAPILMYWVIMVVMPTIASKTVDLLPESVAHYMGEQSFAILEKAFLEESQLPQQEQDAIKALFDETLSALALNKDNYRVFTYQSEAFGANALALPNGTVIVTDDLVTQLKKHNQAKFDSMLMAILLHEIGHVEGKHSMRIVAQSLSNAIVFALLFSDLETVGELLIGASSTLAQANFSRDMENEADDFALENLKKLNYPASAFADAMESFDDMQDFEFAEYLSSHPAIKERIEKARNYVE